jgi:hypothetical protein
MGTKDLDGGRGCLPSVALIILIHHIRKERMEHIGQLIYSQIERVPDAVESRAVGGLAPMRVGSSEVGAERRSGTRGRGHGFGHGSGRSSGKSN